MDPNETLKIIRAERQRMSTTTNEEDYRIAAAALHDAIGDLDEWLSRGGFLPDAWQRGH